MVKVSIIIPVYNTPEKYLRQCLDSVQKQSETSFEALIIDDGSDEKTAAVLDEYSVRDSRFLVFHNANSGVSRARNFGMDKAKGEFITFIDSDDYVEEDMLERMLEWQRQYEADIVMCHHDRVINGKAVPVEFVGQALRVCHRADITMIQEMFLSPRARASEHVWHTLVCTCGKLYRSSLIRDLGFPEDVRNGEDAIFGFRIIERVETMVVSSQPLYHYLQWEGSAAHGFKPEAVESWKQNRRVLYGILAEGNYGQEIWAAYHQHGLEVIKLLLFTVFAHPDNRGQVGKRELKCMLEDACFSESLSKLEVRKQQGRKNKLVLGLIKIHAYGILIWVTRMRLKTVERT